MITAHQAVELTSRVHSANKARNAGDRRNQKLGRDHTGKKADELTHARNRHFGSSHGAATVSSGGRKKEAAGARWPPPEGFNHRRWRRGALSEAKNGERWQEGLDQPRRAGG